MEMDSKILGKLAMGYVNTWLKEKKIPVKKILIEGSGFDQEEKELESKENRIYFWTDVNKNSVLELVKNLRKVSSDLLIRQITEEAPDPTPVYIYINSYGGDLVQGLSAMDEIVSCKVPVYTVIDGPCASAATLMSVVGKKRFMKKSGKILIHQLSSAMWGKYSDMLDEMENMKMFMKNIKDVYAKYTKVPENELDEILKHDLWWDADKCLEYGIIDKIL